MTMTIRTETYGHRTACWTDGHCTVTAHYRIAAQRAAEGRCEGCGSPVVEPADPTEGTAPESTDPTADLRLCQRAHIEYRTLTGELARWTGIVTGLDERFLTLSDGDMPTGVIVERSNVTLAFTE